MLVIIVVVVATTVWRRQQLLWLCRGGVSLHRLLMLLVAVRDVVLSNGGSVLRCDTQELGWYLLQIISSSGLIVAVVVYSSRWQVNRWSCLFFYFLILKCNLTRKWLSIPYLVANLDQTFLNDSFLRLGEPQVLAK